MKYFHSASICTATIPNYKFDLDSDVYKVGDKLLYTSYDVLRDRGLIGC